MNKHSMLIDLIGYHDLITEEWRAIDVKAWSTLNQDIKNKYLDLDVIRNRLEYVIRKLIEMGALNENV